MQPFHVHGPFEFNKNRVADNSYRKQVWSDIDADHPGLPAAKGAYLISLRNKGNYKPVYVGITNALGFNKEVFNSANLVKILHNLRAHKGTLCVHLLAKPKAHHTGFSINVSKKALIWIEIFVLFLCRRKNIDMLNKSHAAFLESVEIQHITSKGAQGPAVTAVASFRNAVDWHV